MRKRSDFRLQGRGTKAEFFLRPETAAGSCPYLYEREESAKEVRGVKYHEK